ncbi:MAG: chorismate mutase [Chloroflexi bacterium]|nr:chorismate mutase [Chloroflexota bacterium]
MGEDGPGHSTSCERPIICRGVRGATTVTENTREAILQATRELLMGMIILNGIRPEDVASAILTTTLDLNAEYPAVAARQLGWHDVPLLCAHEMAVPDGLPMCVRILVMWNTSRSQNEIRHVYIREAAALRPDRSTQMPELIAEIQAELAKLDTI